MAHITAKNSVWISSTAGYAFSGTGPDTLIVDADAFLITSFSGFYDAVRLYDEWTVVINGSVAGLAGSAEGIVLFETNSNNTTVSHITVGKTGDVFGDDAGILAFYDAGDQVTIKNFGMISGNGNSIKSLAAATVANGGTLFGNVLLSDGHDVFKDFVKTGTIVHNGIINGTVDLAAGDDSFVGGAHGESVKDADGSDHYHLGGGNDTYIAINGGGADGTDIVDGGKGEADLYDASSAVNDVLINLDSVEHTDLATVAGNTAQGIDVSDGFVEKDTITGFENASGGAGHDSIFGNSAANVLKGNGSFDGLFGFGGNDQLFGGDGADNLFGGKGADILSGGPFDGADDTFNFVSLSDSTVAKSGRDTIIDFEQGHDFIRLTDIDAIKGGGDDPFTFIGVLHFHGTAGELRESFSNGNSIVSGDVNGDGVADFSIALIGHILLTSSDFIL